MEGGMIPVQYTCTGAGAHPSPELAWTPGPATTKGYAIVLKDNTNNFTHWAIWDIPPSVMELPMGVPTTSHTLTDPAGAKQVSGGGIGYLPPCPPSGTHTYVFTLYAQSALPLTNVQTTQAPDAIMARLATQNVGMTTLSAKVPH
jgi:Raf kinase inhibitor-like YbhB/YbcL family protein